MHSHPCPPAPPSRRHLLCRSCLPPLNQKLEFSWWWANRRQLVPLDPSLFNISMVCGLGGKRDGGGGLVWNVLIFATTVLWRSGLVCLSGCLFEKWLPGSNRNSADLHEWSSVMVAVELDIG